MKIRYFQSNSPHHKTKPRTWRGFVLWRSVRDSSCFASVTPIANLWLVSVVPLQSQPICRLRTKNNSPNCFLHSAQDTRGYLGFQSNSPHHKTKPRTWRGFVLWRRDRDSNPRYPLPSTIDFESTAFDHSAISPFL